MKNSDYIRIRPAITGTSLVSQYETKMRARASKPLLVDMLEFLAS